MLRLIHIKWWVFGIQWRPTKKAYNLNINLIPDKEHWSSYEDLPVIMPPIMKRGVGRPSRNKRREEGEDQKGKRSKTMKCDYCGHFGHNAWTCKGGPTAKEQKASQPMMIKNHRVRDQFAADRAAVKRVKDASKNNQQGTSKSTRKKKDGEHHKLLLLLHLKVISIIEVFMYFFMILLCFCYFILSWLGLLSMELYYYHHFLSVELFYSHHCYMIFFWMILVI